MLFLQETEGIISETDTFSCGKEKWQRLCWYAGKDDKAITLFESCKALGPGEFDTTVLKEVARKIVKISDTCFDDS